MLKHKRPTTLLAFILVGAMFVSQWVSLSEQVSAADPSNFQAGNIISDRIFRNGNAMNPSQIQNFLESKNAVCLTNFKTLSLHDANKDGYGDEPYGKGQGNKVLASKLIWQAAQIYDINPKVILVTLQKEQGLITTKSCDGYKYRTALGYACPDSGPCDSNAYGFTSQIDYGIWHFRDFFLDRLDYVPYTPGRHRVDFHPNDSCGSSVVNIKNRATAALYSYTPYQPNKASLNAGYGTGNGCSSYGNRNFWLFFTDWFGNPAEHITYSWKPAGQGLYADAEYNNKLPYGATIAPGQKVYLQVKAHNTGNQVWRNSFLRLATSSPQNRNSQFRDGSWLSENRIAQMTQETVNPGETTTFEASLTAPEKIGKYKEYFNLVADGFTWLNSPGLYFPINVQPTRDFAVYASGGANKRLNNANISVYGGRKLAAIVKVTNTSGKTWPANQTRLATTNPQNRASVFRNNSWLSDNRASALDKSLAPGESGQFSFTMTAPEQTGTYTESFGLVIDGQEWIEADTTTLTIEVKQHPGDRLGAGDQLSAGKEVVSDDGQYRLTVQTDGNLVLYNSKNKPLWHTRTWGGALPNRLVVQHDGNLVLYNSKNKPLWHTRTWGGALPNRLVVQHDGNLVLYNSKNKPLWHTRTWGG